MTTKTALGSAVLLVVLVVVTCLEMAPWVMKKFVSVEQDHIMRSV